MYTVEIGNVNKQYHSYTVISANYYLVHTCTCSDTIHNPAKYIHSSGLRDFIVGSLRPDSTTDPNHIIVVLLVFYCDSVLL